MDWYVDMICSLDRSSKTFEAHHPDCFCVSLGMSFQLFERYLANIPANATYLENLKNIQFD